MRNNQGLFTMQSNLEATLAQLVSIPSASSNPVACAEITEFVQSEFDGLGLHITESGDTPNPWFIATTQDTKEPDILLAAHLDIVPAPTELFAMQKRGGKLYGRGVYDMKQAAACYIELAKNHTDALKELNVGFLFTTDEEIGGDCIPTILESGWRPGLVFIPDGSDNWQIEKRAKGFYDVEIVARGTTAHGSRPWEGDNAIHKLMDVVNTLRRSFPDNDPGGATLAVTRMNAGQAINQIADYASVQIDFRTFSADEISIYRAQIEQLAKKNNLEISTVIEGAPVAFDETAPAVQSFIKTLREQTGEPEKYTESYGGTDARHFAKYDIPCIVSSPNGGGRHSPEEWLLADDLPKYYQLIERWLLGASQHSTTRLDQIETAKTI